MTSLQAFIIILIAVWSSMSSSTLTCAICKDSVSNGDAVTLTEKGCERINTASKERNQEIFTTPLQTVHEKCRRSFIHSHYIEKDARKRKFEDTANCDATPSKLRSSSTFNFQEDCLFCGQHVNKKKSREKWFQVRSLEMQSSLLDISKKRNDEWARTVVGRIASVSDLHAADAVYHHVCSTNFRTLKGIPKKFTLGDNNSHQATVGRPAMVPEFAEVIRYLEESSEDQVTVADLVSKMQTLCGNQAYTTVWMTQKLKEYYGNKIVLTEIQGKTNVVTFRDTASNILHRFYSKSINNQSEEDEKMKIIRTAAELIRSDICALDVDRNLYPSSTEISDKTKNLEFVPNSLQSLLTTILSDQKPAVKVASLGQAIMQSSRPRGLICPLQIGLGVQLHRLYGSRFLVNSLYSLGFCSSYSEVHRFESSAAVEKSEETVALHADDCVQFVADNVDHNTDTINGENTFHGMGMISSVTPVPEGYFGRQVRRRDVTSEQLEKLGRIRITYFRHSNTISKLKFTELRELCSPCASMKVDLVMKASWPLRSPMPGWSATMQMVSKGQFPGQSSIRFLPIIDMNPSDISCVYSTMKFIDAEAKKYGKVAVVTFDQPLYWKALMIASDSELKDMVIRLGAFHTEMSFLDSVGRIMGGSGLREVLELVYASNTVMHMLNGKAVSRAVRGYMLVDIVLSSLLMDQIESLTTDRDNGSLQSAIVSIYDRLHAGLLSVEGLSENVHLQELEKELENKKAELYKSRTAKLWFCFMDIVSLLRKFLIAERTGNWKLHLESMKDMLPYFAAAGHNLYAKSVYIYLSQMQNLQKTHPDVHALFCNGHHVIRRKERFWGGISTDLAIEQVLMRSIKSTGGLTRGRGLGEAQRSLWLLSMPVCSEINDAMQTFTETQYQSNDQHAESSKARKQRDFKDINTIREFLKEHNPFETDDLSLRNIETGVLADEHVNADNVKLIGNKIIENMENQYVTEYTFKRRDQVVPLNAKRVIGKEGNGQGQSIIQIDPQLMFQRLVIAGNDHYTDSSELFKYELSSLPSSMFDNNGFPREAAKSSLAEAIWNKDKCMAEHDHCQDVQYVLDGGSLLRRIPWVIGTTFFRLCEIYIDHVKHTYPEVKVVFDSYPDRPTTNDVTHFRRSRGQRTTNVLFTESMHCKTKKDLFLSNNHNKQKFIDLLATKMRNEDIEVLHAEDDADLLIAKTAIAAAEHKTTVVIGEDTDILVLLCHYVNDNHKQIIFRSGKQTHGKACRIWDINKTAKMLGEVVCKLLPFVHALSGCDTTARLFGVGKAVALKKCLTSEHFRKQGEVFLSSTSEHEAIIHAGEEAISCMYNGLPFEGLQVLRWRKFTSKTVQNRLTPVFVQSLPPTPNAASFHSLRLYLQCRHWLGDETQRNPEDWGWCIENNKFSPKKMTLPLAPENLLNIIKCNCKTNCDSKRCTCRKSGLDCTVVCGECRGICSNTSPNVEEEETGFATHEQSDMPDLDDNM